MAAAPAGDWRIYRRLLGYVTPWAWCFVLSFLGYVVYSAGTVLLADLMQYLLDALAGERGRGFVSQLVNDVIGTGDRTPVEMARVVVPLAILVFALTRALGFFAGSWCMSYVARNLVHAVRCELFDKMLSLPATYFDRHNRGTLVSKLTFNVEQVAGAATKALKIILRESLVVVGLLAYMLYLNWRLCLVFLAVAPFIALVVRYVGRKFRRYSRRIQDSMGDVTQLGAESVAAWREVRLYAAESQQQQRFARASDYNRAQSLRLALVEALGTPVIQGLLALALGALVWFALSPQLLAGFTPGSLAAFLTAAAQLGKPIRQLSGVQSVLQRGLAAAQDIFEQLDQDSERDSGKVVVERAAGELLLDGVSFRYPGAVAPALDRVCLQIPAGGTLALVGRSGSGKSTLVQLLAGFYRPDAGEIRLDGVALADYRLADLRQQIAVVSQDAPLFHDTLYNNVAFGALAQASPARVQQALAAAHATEFVEALPQGVETVLGDAGEGLSGGQRQRIAIARAFLKDAPLLVLDEATSALDYESESHIQAALADISRDRTTIVIAHRLSTVENADSIAVLDHGRVVAQGTHAQLLAEDGLYAQLYRQAFSD